MANTAPTTRQIAYAKRAIARAARVLNAAHSARTAHEQACDWCGATYTAIRPHSRFCGPVCRTLSHRAGKKEGGSQ